MPGMTERQVLITGGSGGLGVHVTQAFLATDDGTQRRIVVPIPDARQETRLREAFGDDCDRIDAPRVDLTDEAAVASLIGGMSSLDAVVHLVGGFAMGELHEAELSTLQQQLDINVRTTFLVLKHSLTAMRTQGRGRIVTVGSKAAAAPVAGLGIYAAAKAAVVALTQAAAEETKGTDITANCVMPTVIDTPANRAAMGDADAPNWVRPERLAATIHFLCSDAAGDLRGSPLRTFGSA